MLWVGIRLAPIVSEFFFFFFFFVVVFVILYQVLYISWTNKFIYFQACAVMALERVPADIRRDGGVARMTDPKVGNTQQ